MKIAFIGCVDFSYAALSHVLSLASADIVGVVSRRTSKFNADHRSLEDLAVAAGVPVFFAEESDESVMGSWLRDRRPEVIYCFGWSTLLTSEILSLAPLGVIGFHPAALPFNRGRHPLIWALALGLEETASTFFYMDEGADTGDILAQCAVPISRDDDARSLYQRVTKIALQQITVFTEQLAAGCAERRPQSRCQGNHWRKRGPSDGQIDWRMSAEAIYNLVRALTRPYVGAHCVFRGQTIKIWKALIKNHAQRNIEPGKVLTADHGSGQLTVKCGSDAIALIEHDFDDLPGKGTYL